MKQNITLREVALLLVSLAIIGLVIMIVVYTLPEHIPSALSITANSSPTSLSSTTPSPTTIGSRQTTEAPYPGPMNSPTLGSMDSTQTEAAYNTQWAMAGTSHAMITYSTPFYEPIGIYSDTGVQASGLKIGMDAQNSWFGFVDGNTITVFAGALLDEPDQGAVHLFLNLPTRGFDEQILTPTQHGGVRVVSEQNNRLTLVSTDGTTYYFDLPARRFVDSLTEVVPSATPPITSTPIPPPPTFRGPTPVPPTYNPYPAPTGQSTVAP
jgi:hypothetical protein